MCGKFTQMMSWGSLVYLADIIGAGQSVSETVTPMRFANVIRLAADGKREVARIRWGFVPRWEKDPLRGTKFMHARAETLETTRAFADAFRTRRGIVLVKTFNEGKEISRSKTQQHVVTPRDGKPIAIAVVWERWGEEHAGSLETFAMVTVPSNRLIGTITDRMPAVIQPEDWPLWLGEVAGHDEALKDVLRPFDGDWDMQPEPDRKAAARKKTPEQPRLL